MNLIDLSSSLAKVVSFRSTISDIVSRALSNPGLLHASSHIFKLVAMCDEGNSFNSVQGL